MRLVRDVMSHKILYVTREATVRTAVEVIRAHQAEVVPVVDEGRVVGLLDALQLTLYDGETGVLEACVEPLLTVEPTAPLTDAARLMRRHHLRQLPVVQDGRIVGMLSARDLLRIWGQVNDALTGLAVSHQLRDWISRHLSTGTEVVILFLDLNNFGLFNKEHGHVVGDRVLKSVAEVLRDVIDPETDLASRVGGDEFCVATTRRLGSAHDLAVLIRDRVSSISFDDLPLQVGVSIGIAGGRRLTPRPGMHTDATLDDLITRASTASTRAKKLPEHIAAYEGDLEGPDFPRRLPEAERGAWPRVVVDSYQIGRRGQSVDVTVVLRAGSEQQQARVTAERTDINRALATATARCLELLAPEGVSVEVEDTYEYTTPHGMSCVGATISLARGSQPPDRLIGASPIRDDAHRTYINAILDATNRPLGRL